MNANDQIKPCPYKEDPKINDDLAFFFFLVVLIGINNLIWKSSVYIGLYYICNSSVPLQGSY
jgi:hypothetical protein